MLTIDPPARGTHRLDDRLQAVEHPGQVDIQYFSEVVQWLVLEKLTSRNAGIVDQSGERTELIEGELHSGRPLLRVGDVQVGVARVRAELFGQLHALAIEQVTEHHAAAAGNDVARERRTETSRATGDHDDLTGELSRIRLHHNHFLLHGGRR